MEEFNEVMKSEIAVTRRTTYRAENVVKIESAKKKQDLLTDSMNKEIKRLSEQKEASIEKIIMSKKTLLEDWQKSLFGMQQRDKALQGIKEPIKQKNDEISGVKNETRKEQDLS